MKNYALFSVNGRFIGYTNFEPQNGLYKELPDNFDPIVQVYVGDYESGEIKNINKLELKDYREANIDQKWKIYESQINNETGKYITQKLNLPLYKQINAIMETINLNKDKLILPDNFEEIYNTIQTTRHKHNTSLDMYKESEKADIVYKDNENLFIEEYTQQQLNINDEIIDIKIVEEE